MKTVNINEFQKSHSKVLQEVINLHKSVVITQQEQPVAYILPYFPELMKNNDNPLKNSIMFEKDIIEPIDEMWEANK